MIRVSSTDVIAILLKDYDDINTPSLTPFIQSASLLVDKVVACASKKGTPLTSDEEFVLESWLAAHFYCMSDQPFSSKSTAGASGSFQGQTGMGLDATKYGQTAKTMDTTGCLQGITSGVRPSLTWIDALGITKRGGGG